MVIEKPLIVSWQYDALYHHFIFLLQLSKLLYVYFMDLKL